MSVNANLFTQSGEINNIYNNTEIIKDNTEWVDYYEQSTITGACDILLLKANNIFMDMEYGNNMYIAVGYNPSAASLFTSSDGISWKEIAYSGNEITAKKFIYVAYGDGVFVILGEDVKNSQYSLYKTTDGKELTKLTTKTESSIMKLIYNVLDRVFITVGYTSTYGFLYYAYSNDLTTWEENKIKEPNNKPLHVNDIIVGNRGYALACGVLDNDSYKFRVYYSANIESKFVPFNDAGSKSESFLILGNADAYLCFSGDTPALCYRSTAIDYNWYNMSIFNKTSPDGFNTTGPLNRGCVIGDDWYMLKSGDKHLYLTSSLSNITNPFSIGWGIYNIKHIYNRLYILCGNDVMTYLKLYSLGRRPKYLDTILRSMYPIGSTITSTGYNNPYKRLGFGKWVITQNGKEDSNGYKELSADTSTYPYGLEYSYLRIL